MAGAYLQAPLPKAGNQTRTVLTRLVAIAFFPNPVLHKPYVHYWRDPADRRRQIIVAVVPRRATVVPVLRLVPALAPFALALLVLPALMPTAALSLSALAVAVLAAGVVAVALVTSAVVLALPYEGKIKRAGPVVPRTQLTASLAASTAGAGMREVRAYLTAHHAGQRITVRARDERARVIYASLGLKVVAPGRGRMTGVIAQRSLG